MKKTIINGEICFFVNSFDIRYSPLSGEYRVFCKNNPEKFFLLKMMEFDGGVFLVCENDDIEDVIFSIFGLRHNIYFIDIMGERAVDFNVFGRYIKEKCSEKK